MTWGIFSHSAAHIHCKFNVARTLTFAFAHPRSIIREQGSRDSGSGPEQETGTSKEMGTVFLLTFNEYEVCSTGQSSVETFLVNVVNYN